MFQIDYIKNLTLLAVVGEFGFGKVVAVGEYLLDEATNTAEVAFSVSKDWQGKGLGKILMQKLCEAARENGISGLVAYTMPRNQGMIKIFKSLPYKSRTVHDGELLELTCRFNEIESY
jgi:L-amino acid N-acyltransferase YncA